MFMEEGTPLAEPLRITPLQHFLLMALLVPNLVLVVFWSAIDRWTAASVRLFTGL